MKRSLLAELKRRNVIRVAIGYLAVSWLLLQAGSLMFSMFDLPSSAMRGLFVLLVMAFVPTLVFAWVYELTPEGLKRTSEVDRGESISHLTGRKLDFLLIGVLAAAVVLLLIDKFASEPRRAATQVSAPTDHGTAQTAASAEPVATTALADAGIPEIETDPSIAVLPLVNMSSDKEQEYFSDGISEELLNLLAKVPKLRVIARTSSFAFKGEKIDIANVARKLHVAAVLEGSVRKSADRVRITVQLIRAKDSSHLWSETYDRKLDDIFKVQDEIAANVVDKLRITLLGSVPTARRVDPRVYPLILQADALVNQSTPTGRQQALVLYQEALAIAPEEPRSWSGLGRLYMDQESAGDMAVAEASRLAKEAQQKAVALDPNDAVAYARLGFMASRLEGDLAAAASYFQRAFALDPFDARVIGNAATFSQSLGRFDDAIAVGRYIVATLDPTSPISHFNVCAVNFYARHWDQAIASCRTALKLSPGFTTAHFFVGVALLLGKTDAAAALQEFEAEPADDMKLTGLAIAQHALGRAAESDAALATLTANHAQDAAYYIATVYTYRGEYDRAFEWLDKAVVNQNQNLFTVASEPQFVKLHDDPRWLPLLRKIGKAPEQLAKIEFKVTLPQAEGGAASGGANH